MSEETAGRTVRTPQPKTSRRTVAVDAEPLRLRGMPELVTLFHVRAVEVAWEQAAKHMRENGREPGQPPPIVLRCEHPIIDPRTVRATIGVDGEFGVVTATSPGELREELERQFGQRFGQA